MPAQSGASVLLAYGAAGAQQAGSSILLSYDQASGGATTISVRSSRVGKWVKAIGEELHIRAPHAALDIEDYERRAPWVAAAEIDLDRRSRWNKIEYADDGSKALWGEFGEPMNEDRGSRWFTGRPSDDASTGVWSIYGEPMNEDRGGRWAGSKATDRMPRATWRSFYALPTYRRIPYLLPNGLLAHFAVVGGSPVPMQLPGTLANLYLPIAAQFGPELYTAHFTGDPLRSYFAPHARAMNFLTGRGAFELATDGFGNPILGPSNVDTFERIPWGAPVDADRESTHPWLKYSRPLNPGWGVVTPGGPTLPEPGETIIIPTRSVYIVVNEILLARVDDDTVIEATQLSIAFDCDSWLPTFSAVVPESSRDAVMPDPNPVEVYAYINGSEFRFFVEKVARNRQFAKKSVTISGRGLACELSAPYAAAIQHTNASGMTAQQIIDAALQYTSYTQTWNITDWLVPANTFSLYGTPADVAGHVAEATGSVLAADWALRDLRMLPRYPVKPWDWATATPDYVIPGNIVQNESLEWIEKPDYNVVYVSGVQTGVLAQVKRTGTAGDKPAQMVTHPLITHNDAARQRGTSILADTGRKAMMQISMPVLDTTGVLDICRLVEFSDGANTRRGIVRANNVSVNWPTVRQTLTIEAAP